MFTLPFANALGPASGPAGDGVIYGVLPRVTATSVLRVAHLAALSRVLRGNADAGGSVTFTDVSIAAGNDTPNDVALCDTANPTADRLCIELAATDRINGIKFLISTAAVLTGTPAAQVRYKTASGWQSAAGIVTPLLTATASRPRPPSRESGRASCPPPALIGQGDAPDLSGQGASPPITGDALVFGFDARPMRILPSLYRAGPAEWNVCPRGERRAARRACRRGGAILPERGAPTYRHGGTRRNIQDRHNVHQSLGCQ